MLSASEKKKNLIPHGRALEFEEGNPIVYERIGIAIDFAENDQAIIQNALKLGGKDAQYTLIHIVESAAARYLGKNTLDHETQEDVDSLKLYQEKLVALGYKAENEIGFGNAAGEIAKITNTKGLDLLIMGAHGHKGFKDLLFGTTVDKLRHQVKTPILIVK